MEIVRFIVGVILPYAAVVVFVGGMAYRLITWKKLASPPMTLFPAPKDNTATAVNTIQEAVFFKSLFKGDRLLWVIAWGFHAVLLLIFVGHFRVFTPVDDLFMMLGMSKENILAMSGAAGGAAGIAILAATLLLIVRRMTIPRVSEITGFGDYLALLLLAAIIITGNVMRFGPMVSDAEHFNLSITREYFAQLFTFGNVMDSPALTHTPFMVHMCLALLLFLYLPFSKILHFGGIFFTHQLIRRS